MIMKKLLSFAAAVLLAFSAAVTAYAAPSAPPSPEPAYNSLNIWIEDTTFDLEAGDTATVYVSVSDNAYGFEYMKFYLVYPSCLTLKSVGNAGFASKDDITGGTENTSATGAFRKAMRAEGLDADEVLGILEDGTAKNKWTSVFVDCARTDFDAATGEEFAVDCFDNGRIAAFEFKYDETENDSETDSLPLVLIAASDFMLHCDNEEYELSGESFTAAAHGGEITLSGRLPDGAHYKDPTLEVSDALVGEGEASAVFNVSVYNNPGFFSAKIYVIYGGAMSFASFTPGDVFSAFSFIASPSDHASAKDRDLSALASSDEELASELEKRGIGTEGKRAAIIRIENDETDADFLPVDETDNGKLFSIGLNTADLDGGEYEIKIVCVGAENKSGNAVGFDTRHGILTVTDCPHSTTFESNAVAPTCLRRGSYDIVCSECGRILETVTVSALGHEFDADVTPPSCTEGGYTEYTCIRCGYGYIGDETPAKGHDHVASAPVLPTCTENGYVEYVCTGCGDSYRTEIPSTGHRFVKGETVLPSCEEGGYTPYVCSKCGEEQRRDETPARGHYYVRSVFAPTCTEAGYTLCKCSRCGDSFVENETSALGHSYEETVLKPTCEEGGYSTFKCSRCGDRYIANETSPLGHEYTETVVEPTCEDGGYSAFKCSRCGDEYTENEVAPLGHDFVEAEVEPTCTGAGYVSHICTRCGETYTTDEVPPLGHDTTGEMLIAVQPDETTKGLWAKTCPRCGSIIESREFVLIRGDVNGDGRVNSKDLSALKKYMVNLISDEEICKKGADLNNDGRHNSRDVSELKKLFTQ